MPIADEQVVRATLAKYETTFFSAFHGGWEDWRALQLGGRLLFPARSRACVVYDFIVQRAMAALVDDNMLRSFALVGEPADVASQLHDRFGGLVERVSPVIYSPDTQLLTTLLEEIRALQNIG